MTLVFLLVVIVVLLYTRQADRDYTLGLVILIAALTWLAIEIHILRILADLFALALEHWIEIVMAFSAAVLLSVPLIMVYIALRDQLDNRAIRKEFQESHGAVRVKFNRRVAALMAQGYDRERAEAVALRLLGKG